MTGGLLFRIAYGEWNSMIASVDYYLLFWMIAFWFPVKLLMVGFQVEDIWFIVGFDSLSDLPVVLLFLFR